VKEYDLFVPLYYNDGRQIEPQKFQDLQTQLLDQFGGLTFFPQPNEGFWTIAGITYRDEIVIYRYKPSILSAAQSGMRILTTKSRPLRITFARPAAKWPIGSERPDCAVPICRLPRR